VNPTHICYLAAFLIFHGLTVHHGWSADLEFRPENAMTTESPEFQGRCTYFLKGEIEEGDTEKIQNLFKIPLPINEVGSPGAICLDSRGGSYTESLKIIQEIIKYNITTYISDGAECLSACAFIFMSGRTIISEVGVVPSRFLNIGGKLGFHSPSLELPEGIYNKDFAEKSYQYALQNIAQIIDILLLNYDVNEDAWVKPSLISSALKTPPQSMTFVDNIDLVGRWSIALYPRFSFRLDSYSAQYACANFLSWQKDASSIAANVAFLSGTQAEHRSRAEPHSGEEQTGYLIPYSNVLGEGCDIWLSKNSAGGSVFTIQRTTEDQMFGYFDVSSWISLRADTKIADLKDIESAPRIKRKFYGSCSLSLPNQDRQLRKRGCEIEISLSDIFKERITKVYISSDIVSTIIYKNSWAEIDGNRAEIVGDIGSNENCFQLHEQRVLFCYEIRREF
jgi:hypothetical protein